MFREVLKLLCIISIALIAITGFTAFNSFGIDADTIYESQGDISTFMYDRARGYMYSGNTVIGVFQKVTNEDEITEDESSSVTTDESTIGDTGATSNTMSWLETCSYVHRYWGSLGLKYSQTTHNITGIHGEQVTIRTDCSGYVDYCLYAFGYTNMSLTATSSADLTAYGLQKVDVSQLAYGDILQYSNHTEIYSGDNLVLNWGGANSVDNKYTDPSAAMSVDPNIKPYRSKDLITAVYRLPNASQEIVQNPVSTDGKIIYVNGGHGCKYNTRDTGKYGYTETGAEGERAITSDISDKLTAELRSMGYTVLNTSDMRAADGTQGSDEEFGNSGRLDLFMSSSASIFVQIHVNGINGSPTANGAQSITNNAGVALGAKLLEGVQEDTGIRSEKNYTNAGLSILNNRCTKPVVLYECGYHTNANDSAIMNSDEGRAKIAKHLAKQISAYLSN